MASCLRDEEKIIFKIAEYLYEHFYCLYKPAYFSYKRLVDRKKIKTLKRLIKPGMTIIDIGANIGFYTLLFSKLVKKGRVFAFEPEPKNFKHLEQNTKYRKNITFLKKAVGEKTGKIRLYLSNETNVDHQTYSSKRDYIEVDCYALDTLIFKKVDFIKMDIQGYEYYALKGMRKLIENSDSLTILSECWPGGLRNAGVEPMEYINLLKEMGFKLTLWGDIENPDPFYYFDLIGVK